MLVRQTLRSVRQSSCRGLSHDGQLVGDDPLIPRWWFRPNPESDSDSLCRSSRRNIEPHMKH